MIEDALLEAQKLDEGAVGKVIQGVKNMFSGVNKNGGDQNAQQDDSAQKQKEAADTGIDKIKQYLSDNEDISDWPADRLGELIAFLKTQKVFMNSKTAQAELQAIQQQENEAKAKGKVSSDLEGVNTSGEGDPNKVANNKSIIAMINRWNTMNGIGADDLIAYLQQQK